MGSRKAKNISPNLCNESKFTSGSRTKILIVDDNKGQAVIGQMMLEAEGHEVRTATNGNEGCLAYLFFRPDLVITDLQMPDKDGPEMMKYIRALNPEIKTIYMSADFSRYGSVLEDEKERYGVGILKKPFSKMELVRLVSKGRVVA